MLLGRLLDAIARGGAVSRYAVLLSVVMVALVSTRDLPLVRNASRSRTIQARRPLVRDGRIVMLSGARFVAGGAPAGTFEVEMTALFPVSWHLLPDEILLEFDDAPPARALSADPDDAATSLEFAPGIERTARLRFPAPDADATPRAVRLRRPRVRFILERG